MKKNSIFSSLIFILIAGMGNLKRGKWYSILIYFSAIILLAIGLLFAERRFIEPYFHPSQTVKTFAVLLYVTFVFFWNGTIFLDSDQKSRIFTRNGADLAEKHPREQHKNKET